MEACLAFETYPRRHSATVDQKAYIEAAVPRQRAWRLESDPKDGAAVDHKADTGTATPQRRKYGGVVDVQNSIREDTARRLTKKVAIGE